MFTDSAKIEIQQALQLLELDDSYMPNKAVIEKNYRQLSLFYHSDKAGNDFTMNQLSDAKQLLLFASDPLNSSEDEANKYSSFWGAQAELFTLTTKHNIHNTATDLKQFISYGLRWQIFNLLSIIPRCILAFSIILTKSIATLQKSLHYFCQTPLFNCITIVLGFLVIVTSFKLYLATLLLIATPSLLIKGLDKITNSLLNIKISNLFNERFSDFIFLSYRTLIDTGILLRYSTPLFFTISVTINVFLNINSLFRSIPDQIESILMKILASYLPLKITWPHHIANQYKNIPTTTTSSYNETQNTIDFRTETQIIARDITPKSSPLRFSNPTSAHALVPHHAQLQSNININLKPLSRF